MTVLAPRPKLRCLPQLYRPLLTNGPEPRAATVCRLARPITTGRAAIERHNSIILLALPISPAICFFVIRTIRCDWFKMFFHKLDIECCVFWCGQWSPGNYLHRRLSIIGWQLSIGQYTGLPPGTVVQARYYCTDTVVHSRSYCTSTVVQGRY